MSRMLIRKLYSKHFFKSWLILNFNSRLESKVIFSEVRLKRKIAFQSTRHKIWTFFSEKFWVIFSDSHCWVLKCIRKRAFLNPFFIIFGWFKVTLPFQKGISYMPRRVKHVDSPVYWRKLFIMKYASKIEL